MKCCICNVDFNGSEPSFPWRAWPFPRLTPDIKVVLARPAFTTWSTETFSAPSFPKGLLVLVTRSNFNMDYIGFGIDPTSGSYMSINLYDVNAEGWQVGQENGEHVDTWRSLLYNPVGRKEGKYYRDDAIFPYKTQFNPHPTLPTFRLHAHVLVQSATSHPDNHPAPYSPRPHQGPW